MVENTSQSPYSEQTDWYELDEQGEQTVSWKQRLLEKRGAIIRIGVAVIIFAAIILGLFFFIRFVLKQFDDQDVVNNTQLYIEACQSAGDVEKCIESAGPRLAQQTGEDIYCKELEGEDRDSCLMLAALTAQDWDICRSVADQAKYAACHDAIVTTALAPDYSMDDCLLYEDADRVERCQQSYVDRKILEGDCTGLSVDQALCDQGLLVAAAIEAKNPDMCEQVVDTDLQATCYEMVGSGDRDFDGLSGAEEEYRGTSDTDADSDDDELTDYEEVFEYGTDPTNPDSDGDGYPDGTEVMAGYDPLG